MGEYVIEENDSKRRIDRVIRHFLTDAPLPLIYSSIRKGLIKLNGKKINAKTKTSVGDVLYIAKNLELFKKKEKPVSFENTNIDVILKTKDLLFINKKKGDVTHGKNSVDEKIKKSFNTVPTLSFSVGALHRLDKETTGVLAFSQSLRGASIFSKALFSRQIERYYIGLNEGKIKEGLWKLHSKNIKNSEKLEITQSHLLEYSKKENLSLVFYKLVTGKKHQIRRLGQHFDTPLFCDAIYGSKRKDYPTYFLHSLCLHFTTPIFDDVPSFVIAPIPKDFYEIIKTYFPNISLTEKRIEDIIKIQS